MGRIDVQTLVLAFEKRISELEKNPPELISTGVVINLLEKALGDEIEKHFKYLIQQEMKDLLVKEFARMKESYIEDSVDRILQDENLKNALERKVMNCLINSIQSD